MNAIEDVATVSKEGTIQEESYVFMKKCQKFKTKTKNPEELAFVEHILCAKHHASHCASVQSYNKLKNHLSYYS